MSIGTDELRREEHREIGAIIERDVELLIARWYERAVQEQPSAEAMHRPELRDHLPDFLRALGRDLASNWTGGPPASSLRALQHGEQRWHVGWQLSEVVRDYQILRLVVLEWLEVELGRSLTMRESMAIGLSLDESIAAAVVMYVSHQDETLRRSEKEALAAKEMAEKASHAEGEFLANISHELRTPLNSILGLTQLILEEQLSPAAMDYVTTIKDSADVILSLSNGILDYARLGSGRLELDPHPFNFHALVDDTLRSLTVAADEKRLELAYELLAEVPEWLVGDSLRFRQILTNLVNNAVKFTNEGHVVVRVELTAEHQDDVTLEIVVTDTGIGIARQAQHAIFEPFTQAAPSTARKFGGSGLGLAICKELTSRMGGKLWVESELGKGSRFHFTVRLQRWPSPPKASRQLAAIEKLRTMSALVVENNAQTRGIVERTLKEWLPWVTAVDDVAAAQGAIQLADATGSPFQLLIVDPLLPGSSGFALVEWLNAQARFAPTIMMLFSNIDRSKFANRCDELGVAGYLIKPFSMTDLFDAVAEAFEFAHTDQTAHEQRRPLAPASRKLRVLLAEDTPANQKLVRAILTRRGHEVLVVDNGKQAVDRSRSEHFDVILMDLQMPVMDGTTATRLIRSTSKLTERPIPIVALTAHVHERDEIRCREAGMDAFVTKPIDANQLALVLENITNPESGATLPVQQGLLSKVDDHEMPIMKRELALQRLAGNEKLYSDLVGFFLEDAPLLINRILDGLKADDAESVQRAAHGLRGLAANFEAVRVVAVAGQIEQLAEALRLSEARRVAESLQAEVVKLCRAIETYRR